MTDPSVARANNFQLLRFALAITVIWSHSFELRGGRPAPGFGRLGINLGSLAVNGFFLLSGYLITQSWARDPRLGVFLAKRVRRIYPGFLVAFLVSVAVFGPLGAADRSTYWTSLSWGSTVVGALTLTTPETPPVFAPIVPPLVNGSLWTIRYEFGCYLVIAVLGSLGGVRRRVVVAGLAGLVGLAAAIEGWTGPLAAGGPGAALLTPVPRLLTYFLVGSCFSLFRDRLEWTRSPRAALGCGIALVAAWWADRAVGQAVFPLLGGCLLFATAFARLGPTWGSVNRWPDFSYGLYLYAWPVEGLLYHRWPTLVPVAGFLLTLPLAAALGLASWYGVEQPATRGRKPLHLGPRIGAARMVWIRSWTSRSARRSHGRASIFRVPSSRRRP